MTRFLPRAVSLACCFCIAATGTAQKKKRAVPPPAPSVAVEKKPTQRSVLSFEEYDHLLNIIFPIDHSSPIGQEYTIVLRFEPNTHPESQVTLRHWHDGHFEARFEQVLEGNAWRVAASHRVEGQQLDLMAIAHDVPIRRYKVMADEHKIAAWHDQLFPTVTGTFDRVRKVDKQVRHTGVRDAIADGTRYELWYIQGDDEFHAISWDVEVGPLPTGTHSLAKWANEIRFYASSHIVAAAPTPSDTPASSPAPASPATH